MRTGSAVRFVLGLFLGLVVRLWVFTYRVRVTAPAGLLSGESVVFSFWHGQQMALLGARGLARDATVLVSHSKDGDLQAGVMTALGFHVVRGSSSRGGARALAELVRSVRQGRGAALSVDGPRGPRHVAKAGAAAAACATGARLHPVGTAARSAIVLHRAWDGFEIPLPFSRVAVVIGVEISAKDAREEPRLLGDAITACRRRAERLARPGLRAAETAAGP